MTYTFEEANVANTICSLPATGFEKLLLPFTHAMSSLTEYIDSLNVSNDAASK